MFHNLRQQAHEKSRGYLSVALTETRTCSAGRERDCSRAFRRYNILTIATAAELHLHENLNAIHDKIKKYRGTNKEQIL